MAVDTSGMTSVDGLRAPKEQDDLGGYALAQQAENFLRWHTWCEDIKAGYVGLVFEGILGVFYFEISRGRPDVDDALWVVIGDLPPAYIVCDECPNAAAALEGYVGEMWRWVEAAREERPVDDLIPVNVPPTTENADLLGSRLTFIEEKILSQYEEDLEA